MAIIKKLSGNPFLTRVIAIALTIPLVLQIAMSLVRATGQRAVNRAVPVVYYQGEKIRDGMTINDNGKLYVRYKFVARRSELEGARAKVTLPEPLMAAVTPQYDELSEYLMSMPVNGTDSSGKELKVGTLHIDENGNIIIDFLGEPESEEDSATEGATEDEAATEGATEDEAATEGGTDDSATPGAADSEAPGLEESGDDIGAEQGELERGEDNAFSENSDDTGGDEDDYESGSGDGEALYALAGNELVNVGGEAGDDGGEEAGGDGAIVEIDDEEYGTAGEIPASPGTADDGDSGTEGEDATKALADAEEDETNPQEEIVVDFYVPVRFNISGLIPNEDGSYSITMISGGETLNVTFVPAGIAAMNARLGINAFAFNLNAALAAATSFFDIPSGTPGVVDYDASTSYPLGVSVCWPDGTPVQDGEAISPDDTLRVYYYFEMSEDQANHIKNDLTTGSESPLYYIDVPEGLKLPGASGVQHTTMTTIINGVLNMQYGVLYYLDVENGRIYVQFNGNMWNDANFASNSITLFGGNSMAGHIWVSCVLDADGVADGGSVEVKYNDASIINLTVDDPPEPHTVDKTGVYDATAGNILWTVKYYPGQTAATAGITFVDTFDDKQAYVAGSFKASVVATTGSTIDSSYLSGLINESGNPPNPEYDSSKNTLTYTYGAANKTTKYGEIYTFTYRTALKPEAYTANAYKNGVTVRNAVDIYGSDDTDSPIATNGTTTVPIKPENMRLIKKEVKDDTGTYKEAGVWLNQVKDKYIDWRVTVYTKSLPISGDLVLFDRRDAGLTLEGTPVIVAYDESGVQVGAPISATSATTIQSAADIPYGSEYRADATTFYIPIPLANGSYAAKYVVTYTTAVDSDYYTHNDSGGLNQFNNEAWLIFDLTGSGPVPGVIDYDFWADKSGVGVDTRIIQKSGEYKGTVTPPDPNGNNHIIEWTVTVNPYASLGITVATASVTDIIPEDQLFYKPVSSSFKFTYTDGTSSPTAGDFEAAFTTNGSTNAWSLNVTGLGRRTLEFKFQTLVKDEYLAKNGTPRNSNTGEYGYLYFDNTAEFDGYVKNAVVDPTGDYEWLEEEATAEAPVPSEVINKKSGSYDYANQLITWEVKVNKNKLAMPNGATLTDNLITSGQVLIYKDDYSGTPGITVKDADSSTTYASSTTFPPASNQYYVNYNPTTGVLDITLGKDICDGKTAALTIVTEVDVNRTAVFKSGANANKYTIDVKNTAKLTWSNGYSGSEESLGTRQIYNKMLGKSGASNTNASTANLVSYTIGINPNKLNLVNCTLVDSLDPNLRLKVDSVKLYLGTSADGINVTRDPSDQLIAPSNGWDWSYDGASGFTVHFPDGNQSYVLEYDCYIISYAATVSNNVTLKGDVEWGTSTDSVKHAISADSYAHIMNLKQESLRVSLYKVDKYGNTAMSGLSFTLESVDTANTANDYGGPINSGKTGDRRYAETYNMDSNGQLTFYYLVPGWTYRLIEQSGSEANIIAINGKRLDEDDIIPLDEFEFVAATGANTNDQLTEPYKLYGNNAISLTITNNPVATVKFMKVRTGNENVLLNGANFKLTGMQTFYSGQYTCNRTATSKNGIVEFTDVFVSETDGSNDYAKYELRETSAPHGHSRDASIYFVHVYRNGRYQIIAPDGVTVLYDSDDKDTYPELWKAKNTYVSQSVSGVKSSLSGFSVSLPFSPSAGMLIGALDPPAPYYWEDNLVPEEDGDGYIEIDKNGNPTGKWSIAMDSKGNPVWKFTPIYSSAAKDNPSTGNMSLFLWVLSFCAAAVGLTMLIRSRRGKDPLEENGQDLSSQ